MTFEEFIKKIEVHAKRRVNAYLDDKGRYICRIDSVIFVGNSVSKNITVKWGNSHMAAI